MRHVIFHVPKKESLFKFNTEIINYYKDYALPTGLIDNEVVYMACYFLKMKWTVTLVDITSFDKAKEVWQHSITMNEGELLKELSAYAN